MLSISQLPETDLPQNRNEAERKVDTRKRKKDLIFPIINCSQVDIKTTT